MSIRREKWCVLPFSEVVVTYMLPVSGEQRGRPRVQTLHGMWMLGSKTRWARIWEIEGEWGYMSSIRQVWQTGAKQAAATMSLVLAAYRRQETIRSLGQYLSTSRLLVNC
jgi:hypothetical protein